MQTLLVLTPGNPAPCDFHAAFSDNETDSGLVAAMVFGAETAPSAQAVRELAMTSMFHPGPSLPATMTTSSESGTLPDWAIRKLADYRALRQQNLELCERGTAAGALDDPITYANLQQTFMQRSQQELQTLLTGCSDASLSRIVNDPAFDRDGIRLQALAIIEFRSRHCARQQRDDQASLGRALHGLAHHTLARTLADIPTATLAYLGDESPVGMNSPAIRDAALQEFLKRHGEA